MTPQEVNARASGGTSEQRSQMLNHAPQFVAVATRMMTFIIIIGIIILDRPIPSRSPSENIPNFLGWSQAGSPKEREYRRKSRARSAFLLPPGS